MLDLALASAQIGSFASVTVSAATFALAIGIKSTTASLQCVFANTAQAPH